MYTHVHTLEYMALRGQKRALALSELELQEVSCGNLLRSSVRATELLTIELFLHPPQYTLEFKDFFLLKFICVYTSVYMCILDLVPIEAKREDWILKVGAT